ncbi:MAG TPA: acetyl-CoA carboxylase biotin carboxyl carrier protein [Planctomycetes bacterium]|nr:acetyl-CoA carboxylase biotin carboxyl carrier protein [Planctomycetota bacterium]
MAANGKDTNVPQLKELIALMERHGLVEIEIVEEGRKVRLRKALPAGAGPLAHAQALHAAAAAHAAPAGAPATPAGMLEFHSPMVGTFYRAPSPDADPFIEEGSRIEEGDVLCIIEAMKVMNEIKAEQAGTIEKVVVENAHPVEYGELLFVIRPD